MSLEQTAELYASILRQLLPDGVYDTAEMTHVADDIYAHAKALAQADIDAHRLLRVLETIPVDLLADYEREYGLPMQCMMPGSQTIEERISVLRWIRQHRNVMNREYLEQILAIFGVTLVDVVKHYPMQCMAPCNSPVNTERLRYKVLLRLQYPMTADMSCIIENYLPGYLRVEWVVDMPWGEWILNAGFELSGENIRYTAYKTNQRDFYDSYADFDLVTALVRSFHDADMQQWIATKDAINELIGADLNYVWDTSNKRISYTTVTVPDISLTSKNIYSVTQLAEGYTRLDACRLQGKQLGTGNGVVSVTNSAGVYMCHVKRYTYIDSGQTYTFDWSGQITTKNNPKYDASAVATNVTHYFGFIGIAQKILSNLIHTNQATSLLAEAYVKTVAQSLFNADVSKQFIKLSDILPQIEINKTLRT